MDMYIGQITLFAGTYAPQGWTFCQGQLLSISEHPTLFSILGTTFGGNGTTTFGLPDLRGRAPVGAGAGPGLTIRIQGQMSGTEVVPLIPQQMPVHNHAVMCDPSPGSNIQVSPENHYPGPNQDSTGNYGTNASNQMGVSMIGTSGQGQPHNNMQPFSVINYIICLEGIYPSRN